MVQRYANISIPVDLAKAIDDYIKDNKQLGYRSRAEFLVHLAREAIGKKSK